MRQHKAHNIPQLCKQNQKRQCKNMHLPQHPKNHTQQRKIQH
jgi:hypothetical protein